MTEYSDRSAVPAIRPTLFGRDEPFFGRKSTPDVGSKSAAGNQPPEIAARDSGNSRWNFFSRNDPFFGPKPTFHTRVISRKRIKIDDDNKNQHHDNNNDNINSNNNNNEIPSSGYEWVDTE